MIIEMENASTGENKQKKPQQKQTEEASVKTNS